MVLPDLHDILFVFGKLLLASVLLVSRTTMSRNNILARQGETIFMLNWPRSVGRSVGRSVSLKGPVP